MRCDEVRDSAQVERLDDRQLVARARYGETACFALLLARHGPMARLVVGRAVGRGDLADDILQETAVEALVGLDRLRDPTRFGAWLCGIALNVARRWLREAAREVPVADAASMSAMNGRPPADLRSPPEERVLLGEQAQRVRQALATLPVGQRTALALFYLQDRSVAQIATELGISTGAVRARLHAGRRALRRTLDPLREEMVMTEAALVAMRVDQVRREADRGQGPLRRHVVVLREVGGERSLPIWVGPAEAIQIAFALQEEEMPRPLTATFMRDLLRAGGVALTEVRITRLDDNVFYGQAAIHGATGEATVDARPSDAINLALAADAPIRVKSTVLDASQRLPSPPFDSETYPDTAAEIVTEINQQFARDREQLARDLR